ncbi:MAG: 5-(carboxyamino)imidazole ribonucleotide synthase [Saprospiraceae bacterium]|nr:5-(carboxyamino)imidazole ribonucleotide synthase [Saprospiraceae bacterium]
MHDHKRYFLDRKVGVLGGGQLGKMMALAAANWHLPLHILDRSTSFPAGGAGTVFTEGNFKDEEDVWNFGQNLDLLTIEIEHVHTGALKRLIEEGIEVHPAPDKLEIIKDKGRQKQFYEEHGLPTADFGLYENGAHIRSAIREGQLQFPFVQKSRTAGYDGKGVAVIRNEYELEHKLMDTASMVEKLVDIDKELSVIAARNPSGEISTFPLVEMTFEPEANLVEFLICPASVTQKVAERTDQLARTIIETLDICGLLAVEFFLDSRGNVLINEVAPRPHNSGHHTIDSCYTSQFEQHLRAILNMPLGSTRLFCPAVMVNLLGAEGHEGKARYEGVENCMQLEGTRIHLYGKENTRPFRKMGHVTVLDDTTRGALEKAQEVKNLLRVVSG